MKGAILDKTKRVYRRLGRIHRIYHGGKISKDRLIGLVDGATAIIITLMVLEIPIPESTDKIEEISKFGLGILIYFASFVMVGIQWNRHHHIMEKVERVTNSFIWKNLLYMFSLSMVPLFMKWIISSPGAFLPAFSYAVVYLLTDFCTRWIHISSLGEDSGFFHGGKDIRKKYHLFKTLVAIGWVLAILIMSVFLPQVEIFFLIILPVMISLFTIFEDEKEDKEN